MAIAEPIDGEEEKSSPLPLLSEEAEECKGKQEEGHSDADIARELLVLEAHQITQEREADLASQKLAFELQNDDTSTETYGQNTQDSASRTLAMQLDSEERSLAHERRSAMISRRFEEAAVRERR
eukprot:CAMPEP_0179466220 /NCGR_PEP_ID=MMETSP0799-20121207/47583_1 /TAXON_ID=46947 /ORGANISM="Geminigera cryophila, Strain CCMP2564" /LENGTH=124 /DNA_ID=CAMNT_0021270879 /DNA_START=10 /DNA_END=381 /DNA_ORIENTATION=-